MPKIYTASPRSFIENLPFNDSLTEFSIDTSFPINNMSSIYKIKNTIELPLNFLYKQASSSLLMKPRPVTTSSKQIFQLRDACLNP